MKIIELLNKIANGEEVPKEIKIRGVVYKFTQISTRNLTFSDRGDNINYAYENDFENYWLDCARINEEVKIIEKEIEKLDIKQEKNIKNNWKWKIKGTEHDYNISTPQKIMCDKINELIDVINDMRDKEC